MATKPLLLGILASLWLTSVGGGLFHLWKYSITPGEAAAAPVPWPADSGIRPVPGKATLVMAAHPHCPCSRASVDELNLVMAATADKLGVYILFVRPKAMAENWEKADLWEKVSHIPGVTAVTDIDGVEATRFQAKTSGQVVLYNTAGQLIFSGGITPGRGHAGGNEGRSAIVSLLTKGSATHRRTPVYGCPLFGPDAGCANKRGKKCHDHKHRE